MDWETLATVWCYCCCRFCSNESQKQPKSSCCWDQKKPLDPASVTAQPAANRCSCFWCGSSSNLANKPSSPAATATCTCVVKEKEVHEVVMNEPTLSKMCPNVTYICSCYLQWREHFGEGMLQGYYSSWWSFYCRDSSSSWVSCSSPRLSFFEALQMKLKGQIVVATVTPTSATVLMSQRLHLELHLWCQLRSRLCQKLCSQSTNTAKCCSSGKEIQETVFSTIDLVSAYQRHRESRDISASITHDGLFRFCRVPLGLASAPSAFQKNDVNHPCRFARSANIPGWHHLLWCYTRRTWCKLAEGAPSPDRCWTQAKHKQT